MTIKYIYKNKLIVINVLLERVINTIDSLIKKDITIIEVGTSC